MFLRPQWPLFRLRSAAAPAVGAGRRLAALLAVVLSAAWGAQPDPSAATDSPIVVLLDIDGAIGPATTDYIRKGLAQARQHNAVAAVLRIDTPGGLASSTHEIIRDILASPVPVIAYVAPAGARAASAGTYIAYASHVAAMAPATHIGAATPVPIGGPMAPQPRRDPKADDGAADESPSKADRRESGGSDGAAGDGREPDAMSRKAVNDAVAQIRSLAALRGRNADWAERAVRDAASLPAAEALGQGIVEIMATDLDDLLAQADGRRVKAGKAEIALATRGASVIALAPDWRTRLLGVIASPNVAYLLMLLGVYGVLFELMNPGAVVPGVVGGIALLVGLFALNLLPVSYAGLALVALGIALMAAEAFVASFGVLGIGGAAAFALGSLMMFDGEVPGLALSLPVVAVATLASLVLLAVVLAAVVRAHRRRAVTGEPSLVGQGARVLSWQGRQGRVQLYGESWQAVGPEGLQPGQAVMVASRNGLTLVVRRTDEIHQGG